jgi:hypothetical protein
VPLVAAAFCPHPPVLLPELAAGAAGELEALRTACDAAVAALWRARPRRVVVLGSAAAGRRHRPPLRASFAGYGVPVEIGSGTGPPLPLSLAVGVWLLERGAAGRPAATALAAEAVATGAPVRECVEIGTGYARLPEPVALLVMGDGTACRSERAPGYLDPRAEKFDAAVVAALAAADAGALLELDPVLAAELLVAGRAPWQVLAAAAGGSRFAGEVLYDAAPYGVSYTVATWQ